MFQLSEDQLGFIETFGYLHFPGLLGDRIGAVEEAFEELMGANGGDGHDGQKRFDLAPFLNHSPYLVTLLDDECIRGIAAGLLGDDYQYWNSDGNFYVGDTRWHSDTAWPEPLRFYKMALYLDPMTKDTGALRVIPGSHRFGEGFAEAVQEQLSGEAASWGGLPGDQIPAVALETQPGDLVVFNHSTKHSAWGGGERRRMFTIVFCRRLTDATDLENYEAYIYQHGYSKREVFGDDGPLLGSATPERRRHLQQLIEHVPEVV